MYLIAVLTLGLVNTFEEKLCAFYFLMNSPLRHSRRLDGLILCDG